MRFLIIAILVLLTSCGSPNETGIIQKAEPTSVVLVGEIDYGDGSLMIDLGTLEGFAGVFVGPYAIDANTCYVLALNGYVDLTGVDDRYNFLARARAFKAENDVSWLLLQNLLMGDSLAGSRQITWGIHSSTDCPRVLLEVGRS